MADPEAALPLTPSNRVNSGNSVNATSGINDHTSPLSDKSSAKWDPEEAANYPENEEIVYHYLTFDTELPPPTLQSSSQDAGPTPEAPDLSDYSSPFEWSDARKGYITCMSVVATALAAFTAGSYSPAIGQMMEEWNVSEVACLVGITMFTVGFGIAPMVLAPFSEINGRRPVFIVTGLLFVLCQLFCGITESYAGLIVSRFWVGVGGSTFATIVGGVVSDIYHTEDRNTAMALFSGAALFGTGVGPIVGGFIAENTTWRWIFYLQAIMDGLFMVIMIAFFKETRGSVLLSRKGKALNKWYEEREMAGYYGVLMPTEESNGQKRSAQRIRWKVKSDEERASLAKMIGISLYRPFHLLVTEPVVFFFSLWVSFSWAILYLTLAAIPLVFRTNHGFSVSQCGAVFTAISVGAMLMTAISIYQEKIAKRYGKLVSTPEGRLYFACVESPLLVIGLFMFGWTSFSSIHWIAPAIGIAVATMGIFSIYLAVFNYLADVYHRYASSALAAQSFCRNMLGGAFPLITNLMYTRMTYGGASSFLGGVGAVLTLVPWVLVFYGPRIRARSKFASEIIER